MSRGHVFPTDQRWFDFLSARQPLDEVNFWTPRPWGGRFRILSYGEPLFFKLKKPLNVIGGVGRLVKYSDMPIDIAWQTFGIKNGAPDLSSMTKSIERLRRGETGFSTSPVIGCIVLAEPVFWPPEFWLPVPSDFKVNSVRGRGYELSKGNGKELWVEAAKQMGLSPVSMGGVREVQTIVPGGYGDPLLTSPRLGQGAYRTMLLDAYARRCAVTGEATLPVLQAAHIRPFNMTQLHSVNDGLLLRADIHTLFDAGYITVDVDYRVRVSPWLERSFSSDCGYLDLDGQEITRPKEPAFHPSRAALEWHNQNRFLTS